MFVSIVLRVYILQSKHDYHSTKHQELDYDLDYADSYSIEGKNLTADMVETIHYEGKSVYGWTANTSGAMRQIVNSGADGIVTDDVRLLQAFLRENACRKAFESVY